MAYLLLLVRPAALAGLALTLSATQGATIDRSEKLNAPLDYELVVGDVAGFRVTPGGDWVVYRAQQETSLHQLYAMRSDRSQGPVRVSGAGHDVVDYDLHGARVVYRTDRDLFAVGLDLVPVPLNAPLPPSQNVEDFEAVGTRVLFRVQHSFGSGPLQLFSVPIGGGTAVPLTPTPTGSFDRNVIAFLVTPDRTQVVLLANLQGPYELFRVPIEGGAAPAPLCGSFVSGGDVFEHLLQMSPDGTRVVYGADQLNDTRLELFSVPVDGSALPVRLNTQLPTGGDLSALAIDPDGQRVVYRADQTVNDRQDLLVVPIDGSAPPITLATGLSTTADFRISPAGDYAAFQSPCGSASPQVLSVPLDGSHAPIALRDLAPGQCALDVSITADASRVLYRANRDSTALELYSVPLAGGALPVELNRALGLSEQVTSYRLAPDGQHAVYEIRVADRTVGLYSVPADGSASSAAMTPPLRPDASVEDDYLVEGGHVFFRGDVAQREVFELHRAPLDASEPALVLNDLLATSLFVTDVNDFAGSPDGRWAVYATNVSVVSVSLETPTDVRSLIGVGSGQFNFEDLLVSPDSSRVFFSGESQEAGWHVFSVPIDGSSPAVQLSRGTFPSGYGAGNPRVSPDGAWVVYGHGTYNGFVGPFITPADGSGEPVYFQGGYGHFTHDSSHVIYLYREFNPYVFTPTSLRVAPVAGGSAPLELAPLPLGAQATVSHFRVTPDEASVVYRCDQQQSQKFELFSGPLDGSVPPTKISGVLDVDRDVAPGFLLTPDATRAVYAADRDANEVLELYVVPIDGSSSPLELSGSMIADGDVAVASPSAGGAPLVQIASGSDWLVYVADQQVDERFELYRVPVDGSEAPVAVNGPMVANGDVSRDVNAVRISPDGTRVVYLTDQVLDEVFELYSAPLDGSGPAVPLTDALGAGRDVLPGFVILASEPSVLFLADLAVNDQFELWLAPLDGSRPATRRFELAHPAGDVQQDFELAPDERDVLYRADADEDEIIELFRFPIRRVPHHVTR